MRCRVSGAEVRDLDLVIPSEEDIPEGQVAMGEFVRVKKSNSSGNTEQVMLRHVLHQKEVALRRVVNRQVLPQRSGACLYYNVEVGSSGVLSNEMAYHLEDVVVRVGLEIIVASGFFSSGNTRQALPLDRDVAACHYILALEDLTEATLVHNPAAIFGQSNETLGFGEVCGWRELHLSRLTAVGKPSTPTPIKLEPYKTAKLEMQ